MEDHSLAKNSAWKGFPFVLLCVGAIALIAGVVNPLRVWLPPYPHSTSNQNACVNNLRLIDSAKQQWAFEHNKTPTDVPTPDDLRRYLGRGTAGVLPWCPTDDSQSFATSYNINAVGTLPTCKIAPRTHVLP